MLMRTRSFLLLAVLVFVAPSAHAATFLDVDALGGARLSSGGTASLSGTFDVTADGIEGDAFQIGFPYSWSGLTLQDQGGFEVGVHQTTAASVLLAVRDDFDLRLEFMVLELASTDLSVPVEVDFGIERFGVDATLFTMIDATGRLDYEIIARRGDFRVDYAALYVQAGVASASPPASSPPIPEVGSFSAYAVGSLLVLGHVRRRRRA
jgi:hypothetical protein